jgi:hypothetical protein
VYISNSTGSAPKTTTVTWEESDEPYADIEVQLGDTVDFDYTTFHNVRKFRNMDAFDQCEFSGRWISEEDSLDGPTSFLIEEKAGSTIYVGCSVDDHCDSGNMKLAIHVV